MLWHLALAAAWLHPAGVVPSGVPADEEPHTPAEKVVTALFLSMMYGESELNSTIASTPPGVRDALQGVPQLRALQKVTMRQHQIASALNAEVEAKMGGWMKALGPGKRIRDLPVNQRAVMKTTMVTMRQMAFISQLLAPNFARNLLPVVNAAIAADPTKTSAAELGKIRAAQAEAQEGMGRFATALDGFADLLESRHVQVERFLRLDAAGGQGDAPAEPHALPWETPVQEAQGAHLGPDSEDMAPQNARLAAEMADLDKPITFDAVGASSFLELPPADADGFEAESNARFAKVDQKLSALQMSEKADLSKITRWFHKANTVMTHPSSLLERSVEEPMDEDIHRYEVSTKAHLQKLERLKQPSFAEVDAKLAALEARTQAELAKLPAGSKPSSFLELPPGFSELDAKFAAMEADQRKELARWRVEPAPTSLLERAPVGPADSGAKPELGSKAKPELGSEIPAYHPALELGTSKETAAEEDLDARLKDLQDKTKDERSKIEADSGVQASSLAQGVEAKLNSLLENGEDERSEAETEVPAARSPADVDAEYGSLMEGAESIDLRAQPGTTSMLQERTREAVARGLAASTEHDVAALLRMHAKVKATQMGYKELMHHLRAGGAPTSLLETHASEGSELEDPQIKHINDMMDAYKSGSFLEDKSQDWTVTGVHAALAALEERTKAALSRELAPATPSSMLENGKYRLADKASTMALDAKRASAEKKLAERKEQWAAEVGSLGDVFLPAKSETPAKPLAFPQYWAAASTEGRLADFWRTRSEGESQSERLSEQQLASQRLVERRAAFEGEQKTKQKTWASQMEATAALGPKLAALKTQQNAELARLEADPAVASFIEHGDMASLAAFTGQLKAVHAKAKAELVNLEPAAPSSFVQEHQVEQLADIRQAVVAKLHGAHPTIVTKQQEDDKQMTELADKGKAVLAKLKAVTLRRGEELGTAPSSLLEEVPDGFAVVGKEMFAKLHSLRTKDEASLGAGPSSLLQHGAAQALAQLRSTQARIAAAKADLGAKLQAGTAAPASPVEPDSFAELLAKLHALHADPSLLQTSTSTDLSDVFAKLDGTKAELAKLQAGLAEPSSFVADTEPSSFAEGARPEPESTAETVARFQELTAKMRREMDHPGAAKSSLVQEGAPNFADITAELSAKLHELKENDALGLKSLAEVTKENLAKIHAPPSFVQLGQQRARGAELPPSVQAPLEEGVDRDQLHALELRYGVPASQSFLEAEAAKMSTIERRLTDRSLSVSGRPLDVSDGSMASWAAADRALRTDER